MEFLHELQRAVDGVHCAHFKTRAEGWVWVSVGGHGYEYECGLGTRVAWELASRGWSWYGSV